MRTTLLLSGGMDSLVLLAQECCAGRKPSCITFDYGQRHRREIVAAGQIASFYDVTHKIVFLPPAFFGPCALTGYGGIPHTEPGDSLQELTIVPGRNLVLISVALAVNHLMSTRILIGANSDDATIYPDCRKEFISALNEATRTAYDVSVEAPLIGLSKRDIVRLARQLSAPVHMAWSCYEGGDSPCGECGACRLRIAAEAD